MAARRVLFKISGKSLDTNLPGRPINYDTVLQLVEGTKRALEAGVEVAIMPGAGNIIRGSEEQDLMDRVTADQAGMGATIVNAKVICGVMEKAGLKPSLHSTVYVPQFAQLFSAHVADSELKDGMVVVLAGGTGRPFFTTDTGAVLLGTELRADFVAKGTHSYPGVFTADPATDPSARHIARITYKEVMSLGLRVMDITSIAHAMEHRMPVRIFHQSGQQSIFEALTGKDIGSLITA
jgi:uridylate kinase